MKNWKNIRLELARTAEFPTGSVSRGYLLRLPLDDSDFVDRRALARSPHRAKAQRFWSTEPDEAGVVIEEDDGWAISCNGWPSQAILFDGRPIRLGQQVSVVGADGRPLPFTVASIK